MVDIYIKESDTSPSISGRLQDAEGNSVNLAGASVKFSMGYGGQIVSLSDVSIIDPSTGTIRYDWNILDTLRSGEFDGEFQVTYSDNTVETFPRKDYIKVHIEGREGDGNSVGLLDLALASANARSAKVNAADLFSATADRFLDLNGDGFITGADQSLAVDAVTNMQALKNSDAATITAFGGVPAAINAMLDGTDTPVPVKNVNSKVLTLDMDDSGVIDVTDLIIAETIVRYGT